MKVKDLLKKLKEINPEAIIILSSDPEGNSFHTLQDVSSDLKIGAFGSDEVEIYNQMSVEDGELSQKKFDKLKDCVILWP